MKNREVRINLELIPWRNTLPRAQARFWQAADSHDAAKDMVTVRSGGRGSGMQVFSKGGGTWRMALAAKDVFEGEEVAGEERHFGQDVMKRVAKAFGNTLTLPVNAVWTTPHLSISDFRAQADSVCQC